MSTIHAPELLIVMHGNATAEQVEHVVERLEEAGATAHVSPGKQATVIGAIGERELIAGASARGIPGCRPRASDPQAVQARLARDLARTRP
jgi:hypothetical protein